MKKIEHTLMVKNRHGIHARPAALISKTLRDYQSKVTFECNHFSVDAKQIMSLLLLEAKQSTAINVLIEGADADEVLVHLLNLFDGLDA